MVISLLIASASLGLANPESHIETATVPLAQETKTETSGGIDIGKDGISVSKTTETVTKLAAPPDKVSLKQAGGMIMGVNSSYVNMLSFAGQFGVRSLNPKGDFPGNEGGKRNCLDLGFSASVGASTGDYSSAYFNAIGTVAYTFLKLNPQTFEEIEASADKRKRNGFGFNLGLGAGIAGGGGGVRPTIAPKIGIELPTFNYGTASYKSKSIMALVIPIPSAFTWSLAYNANF